MALQLFYFLTLAGIICCDEVIKLTVKEGEDVILPCSLDSTNIRTETFDWKKDDQKNVFQYSSGSHYNNGRGGQDQQFKGRVFHFEDQLQSGNASIEIRKTKVTDSGSYSCIFPHHQPKIRSIIELFVETSVTMMRVREDEDVILPCSLDSTNIRTEVFEWKKDYQRDVFFYSSGSHPNNGRGGQDPQFKGRVFHFEDQLQSGNASIEIRKTKKTDSGYYICIFPFHHPEIRSIIQLIVETPVTKMSVNEDEDVILPCSFGSTSIKSKTFDWKKDDQRNVFMFSAGSHYNNGRSGQDPQFKGRVFHFEDQLQSGSASIVIRKTKVTDSGSYICIFPFDQPRIRSIIQLNVDCILKDRTEENINGSCPKPSVTILDDTIDQAQLECKVQGAFPKPKVQWLDSENNRVPAEETQVTTTSDQKYTIILKTPVTKSDVYRCVSTQEEICHQIDHKIKVSFYDPEFPYGLFIAVTVFSALLLIHEIVLGMNREFTALYYGLLVAAVVSGATVVGLLAVFVRKACAITNCSREYPYQLLTAVAFFTPVLLLIHGILLVPNIRIIFKRRYTLYHGLLVAAVVSGATVVGLLAVFVTETCAITNCSRGSSIGLIVVVVLGLLLVLGEILRRIFRIFKIFKIFRDELKDMTVTYNAGTQSSRAELEAERAKLEAERAKLEAERRAYFEGRRYVSSADFIIPEDIMKTLFQQNGNIEGYYENFDTLDQQNDKDPGGSKAGTIFFNEHED